MKINKFLFNLFCKLCSLNGAYLPNKAYLLNGKEFTTQLPAPGIQWRCTLTRGKAQDVKQKRGINNEPKFDIITWPQNNLAEMHCIQQKSLLNRAYKWVSNKLFRQHAFLFSELALSSSLNQSSTVHDKTMKWQIMVKKNWDPRYNPPSCLKLISHSAHCLHL